MRSRWIGVPLCALIAACASLPTQKKINNEWALELPFDVVWRAAVEAIGEQGYPVTGVDKESGIITSGPMTFEKGDGYADCGSPGLNDETGRVASFSVLVHDGARNGEIAVSVNTRFTVVWGIGNAGRRTVRCASTGQLESAILGRVARRAREIDAGEP